MDLILAIGGYLLGIAWIFLAFRDDQVSKLAVAAVWIAVGVKYTRKYRSSREADDSEDRPMVKHIVVYTLKPGVDKDAAVKLIASKLEPLVGQIPGLLKLEVRRCFAGMDYALYSEFERPEDVPAYRAHPLHQEAKSHFHHLLDQRVFTDYEV